MAPLVSSRAIGFAALMGLVSCPALGADRPYPRVPIKTDRSAEQDTSLQTFVTRFRKAVADSDINWIDQALSSTFSVINCNGGPLEPCAPGQPKTRASSGATAAERLRNGLSSIISPDDISGDMDMDDGDESDAAATPGKPAAAPDAAAPAPPPVAQGTPPPASPPAPGASAAAAQAAPAPAKPKADPPPVEMLVIGQLAGLLEADSMGSHPDVRGVACIPAWPSFDRAAAKKVLAVAGEDDDNLRVASGDTPVYAEPRLEAPVLGTLRANDLVPLMDDQSATAALPGWTAVRLPDGRLGYAEDLGLDEIAPTGPCFVRENGSWKIAFLALRDR